MAKNRRAYGSTSDPQYPQFYDPQQDLGGQQYGNVGGFGYYEPSQDYGQMPGSAPFGYYDPSQYGPVGGPPPPHHQGPQMPGGPFLNQQVIMQAGSVLLQNQMAAAAGYYSQEMAKTSSTWFGNLKYYFAVDTSYVMKKLLLLFFPFTHTEWAVKFNPTDTIAPKDDVNAPDLYIPMMAFVTYVLVAGYMLGSDNRFSPEQLGIQASAALAWLIMEVVLILVSLYLTSISSTLGFCHLLSYCGYKFVCMIAALLVSVIALQFGYYCALAYCSITLGFFLMRSLNVAIQTSLTGAQSYSGPSGTYLVIGICLIQPLIMYWLTRHLLPVAGV